ncbi:hypothetical protein FOBRF1_013686 [Fusarium oxysporum]
MKLSVLTFVTFLAATASATKYIYYGALAPGAQSCSKAGNGCAAWICDHPDPANKYNRGCSVIDRCRSEALAACPAEFKET